MNSTLCIIVPCYNEEAALPYFLQEIRKVANNMSTTFQLDFEILFINDGSRDKTLQILRQAKFPKFSGLTAFSFCRASRRSESTSL